MIKIKTKNINYAELYSHALFDYNYNAKEKMILEDSSYITRTVNHLSNPKGTWNYYNKNDEFIRQIHIEEHPFRGIIPESGDEEDDQYGIYYSAEVYITMSDFKKEKLNEKSIKLIQNKINKELHRKVNMFNLNEGILKYFKKTIEEGEKGWCPTDFWLPYDICNIFNDIYKDLGGRANSLLTQMTKDLSKIYELSKE